MKITLYSVDFCVCLQDGHKINDIYLDLLAYAKKLGLPAPEMTEETIDIDINKEA